MVDAIALELKVRTPTNVTALAFDSAFFTDEYPAYICTPHSGDSSLDSLAIVDHMHFRMRDAPPPPEKPMTTPIELN